MHSNSNVRNGLPSALAPVLPVPGLFWLQTGPTAARLLVKHLRCSSYPGLCLLQAEPNVSHCQLQKALRLGKQPADLDQWLATGAFYLPYLTADCHACCRQHVLARKRDHVVEWFKCILLQFQVLWRQVHIITHEDFSIMRVSQTAGTGQGSRGWIMHLPSPEGKGST